MAITVKKITLWCKDLDNKPGALAAVLAPLANAGADLEVVMGTSFPGDEDHATVGVFPVQGRKSIAAAKAAGLDVASSMPALLVVGDDRQGLGHRIAQTIADAGINIGFVIAQRVGQNFSAVFGFQQDSAAQAASRLIKKVVGPKGRPAARAPTANNPAQKKPAKKPAPNQTAVGSKAQAKKPTRSA